VKKVKTVEVPVEAEIKTVQVVEEVEEELPVQKSDSSAKRDLLQWVQNQVKDYDVSCKDFTKSWQNGKLLTALIHSLKADTINYPPINDPLEANTTAINVADSKLDIPQIIDPDDITNKPEELR
jgi:lysyl-tRNA synthetase class II